MTSDSAHVGTTCSKVSLSLVTVAHAYSESDGGRCGEKVKRRELLLFRVSRLHLLAALHPWAWRALKSAHSETHTPLLSPKPFLRPNGIPFA